MISWVILQCFALILTFRTEELTKLWNCTWLLHRLQRCYGSHKTDAQVCSGFYNITPK